MEFNFLDKIIILMFFAVLMVVTFKKLKLSPVLGYLVAGAVIGEHGLNLSNHNETKFISEFGVVFLLFVIGLELSFERLRQMSKYVFGLGSLQVIITSVILSLFALPVIGGNLQSSIVGVALALSSTAMVLQILNETKTQSTKIGRVCLSILLLQDFAVVPLLIIIPIVSSKSDGGIAIPLFFALLKALFAMAAIFFIGRVLLRPVFRVISSSSGQQNSEIFVASTILVVLVAAYATEHMGLSMVLGAFFAGIMVAETEFRVAAEESIYPFKSILLGLFFMSVGMTIDIKEVIKNLGQILAISFVLVTVKTSVIYVLCRFFKFPKGKALHTGFILSQGSEFAFILFEIAGSYGIIEEEVSDILLLVITLTMAITPLLSFIGQKLKEVLDSGSAADGSVDFSSNDLSNHVIIGGYGTVGKVISTMLEIESISYVALEIDQEIVKKESKEHPILKGDISQIVILKEAGIQRCIAFIISVDNYYTVKRSVKIVAENYPDVPIIVRVRNLNNSTDLLQEGVSILIPEDLETGLQLGGTILKSIGISDNEVNRIKDNIRASNYNLSSRSGDLDSLSEIDI